jgi:hypothetical protein
MVAELGTVASQDVSAPVTLTEQSAWIAAGGVYVPVGVGVGVGVGEGRAAEAGLAMGDRDAPKSVTTTSAAARASGIQVLRRSWLRCRG